jgi:hypothetical protein
VLLIHVYRLYTYNSFFGNRYRFFSLGCIAWELVELLKRSQEQEHMYVGSLVIVCLDYLFLFVCWHCAHTICFSSLKVSLYVCAQLTHEPIPKHNLQPPLAGVITFRRSRTQLLLPYVDIHRGNQNKMIQLYSNLQR